MKQSSLMICAVLLFALLLGFVFPFGAGRATGAGDLPDKFPSASTGSGEPVTTMAAGGYVEGGFTCAVVSSGKLQCWGQNTYGQLGDGTTTNSSIPLDVSGLTSSVSSVATGASHACALVAGGVKCWGENGTGQLGDGTTSSQLTPVTVSGLASGVAQVAAGSDHTCALTSTGGVKCWGGNWDGQLGNGSTISSGTPVDVNGLTSGVAMISAASDHTCAVTTGGGVKCWGANDYGQLGNGTSTGALIPVDVTGLTSGVAQVSAGWRFTCAVTTAGGAKCWGVNYSGQLGNGTNTHSSSPVDVTGLTTGTSMISVSGKVSHSCAVTTSGSVKCWGHNDRGQLGNGTTTSRNIPTDVTGLSSGIAQVSAGGTHSCARTNSGAMFCWGLNWYGQLGDGTMMNSSIPVAVLIGPPVPVISLTPSGLTFGTQFVGRTSLPQTIEVMSSGEAPLIISDISVSSGFVQKVSCPLAPQTLNPGETCTIDVAFTPTGAGDLTGSVTITSNVATGSIHVPLTGKSILPGEILRWTGGASLKSYNLEIETGAGNALTINSFVVRECTSYSCDPFLGCTCYAWAQPQDLGSASVVQGDFSNGTYSGRFDSLVSASGVYTDGVTGYNWTVSGISLPDWLGVVDPYWGGSVTSPDAFVSFAFAPGAVAETMAITLTQLAEPSVPGGGLQLVGNAFQLSAVNTVGAHITPSVMPTMTVRYADSDLSAAGVSSESSLEIYQTGGSTWISLFPCGGCTQDADHNRIIVVANPWSEFALFGSGTINLYLPLIQVATAR